MRATPGGPGSSSDFSGSVSRGRMFDPGPPPWSLSPPCPPRRVLAEWLGLTHCWEVFLLQPTPTSHTLSETVVCVCVCVCVCVAVPGPPGKGRREQFVPFLVLIF